MQVQELPVENLLSRFFLVNVLVYLVQIGFWVYMGVADESQVASISFASKVFFAGKLTYVFFFSVKVCAISA